ncbi:hypothetical protein [Streptomyces sp. NPDC001781]
MRTTWAVWAPDDMRDAAESEARAGFDALAAPKRHFLEVLPYHGAYTEYEEHVAACGLCQQDEMTDCPVGEELSGAARIGLDEQHRLAASN